MTPQRLASAGEHALAAGLELWFSPVPVNLQTGALPGYFARCAREAERLRRAYEGQVVLVLGCEISLWCAGFFPGDTALGRIATVTDPALESKPDVLEALGRGLERARRTHHDIVRAARNEFAGGESPMRPGRGKPSTGSCLTSCRSTCTAIAPTRPGTETRCGSYYAPLGKPVAVTEFGCCTYRGAAARGGLGWMIADENSDPPVISGTYERDEEEQVRHLREMLAVYETEDIDSAFWFTFAGFEQPRHLADPHRDLDLASYGVVAVLGSTPAAPPTRTWPGNQSRSSVRSPPPGGGGWGGGGGGEKGGGGGGGGGVGRQVADRRIGRYPLSALEVAGSWALAAVPVPGLEHSDENAAARAGRFGRPELARGLSSCSDCWPSSAPGSRPRQARPGWGPVTSWARVPERPAAVLG